MAAPPQFQEKSGLSPRDPFLNSLPRNAIHVQNEFSIELLGMVRKNLRRRTCPESSTRLQKGGHFLTYLTDEVFLILTGYQRRDGARNAPSDRSREEQKKQTQMRGGEDPRRSRWATTYQLPLAGAKHVGGLPGSALAFSSFTYPFPLDPQPPPSRRHRARVCPVAP